MSASLDVRYVLIHDWCTGSALSRLDRQSGMFVDVTGDPQNLVQEATKPGQSSR
jgi:hypothetical protein